MCFSLHWLPFMAAAMLSFKVCIEDNVLVASSRLVLSIAHRRSPALAGARDGWRETMRRTFEGRGFYACTGALETVDEAVEQWSYGPTL